MTRQTYVWDRELERIVPKDEYARPYSPKPYSDTCEIQSQINGRVFTSKAGLRQQYRQHGVIEVGNEVMRPTAPERPRITRDEIRRTIQEHKNGR